MEDSALVRICIQTANCIRWAEFVEGMFGGVVDYYTQDHFNRMRENFGRWYCSLDLENSRKFVELCKRRNGVGGA